MNDDAQAVPTAMDLMARVFVARLPVRYEKINSTVALCRADPATDANWIELHRLLHSLADAAGAFGCDGLCEQAGLIQLLLDDMLKQDARSAADADEVVRLLAVMQSVIG